MKKYILFLALFTIYFNINAQIQLSNFTYNNVANANPGHFRVFNGKIIFIATTDGHGRELWSSNGTPVGTNILKDVMPGSNNGISEFFSTVLNGELFFTGNTGYVDGEIWKTDGTEVGTSLVMNFVGRMYGLTTVGNLIYFTLKAANNDYQIWKTDGTSAGTILVKEIPYSNGFPSFQGSVNNHFIFTIRVPSSNDSKVWRSDGTAAGTYPLTAAIDGNGASSSGTSGLSQYIHYNNKLYFVSRYSLYATDGTTAGTTSFTSPWNQYEPMNFGDAVELNGKMYFSFYTHDLKKLSIYRSDGTSSGTSQIYTVTGSQYFYPSYLRPFGDNLLFSSKNSTNGTSLFNFNSNTNVVSEIVELDQNPQEPYIFSPTYSALSLDHIDGDIFYVNSPKNYPQRKGSILDKSTLTLTPVAALDRFPPGNGAKIVFNNELYYSYNYQFWKFDTNTLSTKTITGDLEFDIFPNPTSEFVYFSKPADISQIKIYDVNGKLVLVENILKNNSINVGHLNAGAYIITIVGKNGSVKNRKLLKK